MLVKKKQNFIVPINTGYMVVLRYSWQGTLYNCNIRVPWLCPWDDNSLERIGDK